MDKERKVLEIIRKFIHSKRCKKINKSKSRGSSDGLTAGEIAGRMGLSFENTMSIISVLKRENKIKPVREKYWVLI